MPPMPQLSYLICISKLSDLCCECDLSHYIIVKLDMSHKFLIFEWMRAVEYNIKIEMIMILWNDKDYIW